MFFGKFFPVLVKAFSSSEFARLAEEGMGLMSNDWKLELVSLLRSEQCSLENLRRDWSSPHIWNAQMLKFSKLTFAPQVQFWYFFRCYGESTKELVVNFAERIIIADTDIYNVFLLISYI